MVQVDVFWSYGIGAGFAAAASRQIERDQQRGRGVMTGNPFFTNTLLFLSLCFAPSGLCLLWAFTSWETMHVFTYETLPAWLVTLFAITNVTQGILGYWVVARLLAAKKRYMALLQVFAGYFLMFFILVHGWDGTGYQRFFSFDRAAFLNWGVQEGWRNALDWLTCPVALTLYAMGVVMIPWMLIMSSKWTVEGYCIDEAAKKPAAGRAIVCARFLALIFFHALGLAITSSLLIHLLGLIWGPPVFAAAAYLVFLRKGGLTYRLAIKLIGRL